LFPRGKLADATSLEPIAAPITRLPVPITTPIVRQARETTPTCISPGVSPAVPNSFNAAGESKETHPPLGRLRPRRDPAPVAPSDHGLSNPVLREIESGRFSARLLTSRSGQNHKCLAVNLRFLSPLLGAQIAHHSGQGEITGCLSATRVNNWKNSDARLNSQVCGPASLTGTAS
jgi:hypothetical protein